MTKENTPVYPTTSYVEERQGITLRDYFAVNAMKELINKMKYMDDVAPQAYEIADAMMKERGRNVGRE